MIYLDNAATTLIKPQSVPWAVKRAVETMSSPGRGNYPTAMRAADLVLDCRIAAAELFKVPEPEQVVFTMNATHALNIAIGSLCRRGSRVLISGFEHNAVTRPLRAIGAEIRTAGETLFDPEKTLREFRSKIKETELVICTHVSNVFGYLLPICEIADLCRENGVPLIVDASQSAGVLDVDIQELDAAFVAMPGHKALMGPQGTGLLLCGQRGRPLLYGGSGSDSAQQDMPAYLPDRLEAGTQNVPGIAGLLEGIRFVRDRGPEEIRRHERKLLRQMYELLSVNSGLKLFFSEQPSVQTCALSIQSDRYESETLARLLGERGVCVRGGLHCAPTAHRSAGTLEGGTLRLSVSAFSTERDVEEACRIVREVLNG